MASDDYDFLVFKILTYLYACFRRRSHFDEIVFRKKLITSIVSEEYLTDVLRFMTREKLIEGLTFVNAWGGEYVLANDYSDMEITPNGIRYLLENSVMQQIKQTVLDGAPGAILELVKKAF